MAEAAIAHAQHAVGDLLAGKPNLAGLAIHCNRVLPDGVETIKRVAFQCIMEFDQWPQRYETMADALASVIQHDHEHHHQPNMQYYWCVMNTAGSQILHPEGHDTTELRNGIFVRLTAVRPIVVVEAVMNAVKLV